MSPFGVMAGELGDIFWDLPPWIAYEPGFDLGCTVYVANHTGEEKEYALIGRLYRNEALLSEEAMVVYGHAWFTVAPGDFIRIFWALRFDETHAVLVVSLVDRETEDATDSVSTWLVSPAAAGALPPPWPGAPGAPADWSSMLWMMLPIMMMARMGMAIARPEKERIVVVATPEEARRLLQPEEARKLLPPGRRE